MYWLERIDIRLTDWLRLDLSQLNDLGVWLLFVAASIAIYLVPLILLAEFFIFRRRLLALKATIIGLAAWLAVSYPLGRYLFDTFGWRARPFIDGGLGELLFETPFKAFPSDHSVLLMAVTLVYLTSPSRRLARWLLFLTAAVGLGRVIIGFHFVGDILGGWLIGAGVFGLSRLVDRPLDRLISRGLKLIGLANG